MLNISKNFLSSLDHSITGPGIKFLASKMGINIDQKKNDIETILTMTEIKTKDLDRYMKQKQRENSPVKEKTIQDHVNKRILTLLESAEPKEKEREQLDKAKSSLTEISEDLHQIIQLRKKKEEHAHHIKKLRRFLKK